MPRLFRMFCLLLIYVSGHAQDSISTINISDKCFEAVASKQRKTVQEITKQEDRLLTKLQKQEANVYKYLRRIDSNNVESLSVRVGERYQLLQSKIKKPLSATDKAKVGKYIPRLDSLTTMLTFLRPLSAKKEKLEKALSSIEDLKASLAHAGDIKTFISERQETLKSLTQQFSNLPSGITKSIGRYSKEVFYYKERLAGWKEKLNNPEKLEADALKLLRNVPAFQEFMQQHSELAGLFPMPANYGTSQALAGLQTRGLVQNMLLQQIGQAAGSGNVSQFISQQLTAAQNTVSQLKDKAAQLGKMPASEDIIAPEFKPNNQKTKSFLRRLEYGFNVQNSQRTDLLPTTTDIAIFTGYKFTDRMVAGIGASGKVGWGKPWKDISVSGQGIGPRSYIDVKAKGNIWLTAGLEYNYQQAFKSYRQLSEIDVWQRSGLVGLTKKITSGKHSGKIQVLWDFLSYSQLPKTQALKFRIGYSL